MVTKFCLVVALKSVGSAKALSIIQGSAIGPVSYDINASDLSTVTPGNQMYKYADDTYLVIPTSNIQSREIELNHVAEWALKNNLKLNRTKTVEIIFRDRKRKQPIPDPPTSPDIQRESQIKILGITITKIYPSASTFVTSLANAVKLCTFSKFFVPTA